MNISELSNLIWENSAEIPFGNSVTWEENTFLKSWFETNNLMEAYEGSSPGWYWFICNMSYQEIHDLQRPNSLPTSGCDFGLTAHENIETFGEYRLCNNDTCGPVIYNGHEGNVIGRIRTHFNLNNGRTGALGIKHYPLSSQTWIARVFTTNLISNIPQQEQADIRRLIGNKTGRCAVESAWRTNHGWPVLCKQ